MFAHRRYFNPVILNVVENLVVNLYFRERERGKEIKRDDSELSLLFLEKIRKTVRK